MLLEQLSYDRKEAIVKDKELMKRVKNVYKMFKDYMNVKPNTKTPISSLLLYGVRPQSGIKKSILVVWECSLEIISKKHQTLM